MKTALRASLVFGSCIVLAGTLIGCVANNVNSVKPTANGPEILNGSLTASRNTQGHLVINFSDGYRTQTAGAHHTELRLMYTCGLVNENDKAYYWFGLNNGGTSTAPYLAIASASAPATDSVQTSALVSAANSELPIFSTLASGSIGDTVDPTQATNNFIFKGGILKTLTAPVATDDPFSIDFTATPATGSYSDPSKLPDKAPLFNSSIAAFKNVFTPSNMVVTLTTNKTTTIGTTIPSPIASTSCAVKATEIATNAQKTVCFRIVLPGNVQSVDLGYIPGGRLNLDIRRFDTVDNLVGYGYGTFLVIPGGSTVLNAGNLVVKTGLDSSPITP